jgi:hypothetical protein
VKVKRDKALALLEPVHTTTAEEYADVKAEEHAKFVRDRKMRAVYTVRNLMKDLGFYEFLKLIIDGSHFFDWSNHPSEQDGVAHQELMRIARVLDTRREHPAGKPVFLSLRLTPDEARAIAKWHDTDADKKATYAEIAEFARVVFEQNLEELIRELRPVLPAKIKRRRRG